MLLVSLKVKASVPVPSTPTLAPNRLGRSVVETARVNSPGIESLSRETVSIGIDLLKKSDVINCLNLLLRDIDVARRC
jgi:hypothetical protein